MENNIRTWRTPHPHDRWPRDYFPAPYTATRFFDNMCFIGDPRVACFLLETDEGLVLIDAMDPTQHCVDLIESGIIALGHKPEELAAILITHGHGDHWGEAGYFKKKYGCKVYMSEVDYNFATNLPGHFRWKNLDYPMDAYLEDGMVLNYGNTSVLAIHTPGHTAGCMSFIISVYDEGRPHMLALWGGTGIMPDTDPDVYIASVEKFKSICKGKHVDAEVSNHPYVDNLIHKLEIINHIVDGVANPFVIGEEAIERYMDMFKDMAERAKVERANPKLSRRG